MWKIYKVVRKKKILFFYFFYKSFLKIFPKLISLSLKTSFFFSNIIIIKCFHKREHTHGFFIGCVHFAHINPKWLCVFLLIFAYNLTLFLKEVKNNKYILFYWIIKSLICSQRYYFEFVCMILTPLHEFDPFPKIWNVLPAHQCGFEGCCWSMIC